MVKKHDNEFKVMIVELLKSGSKPKELGAEYNLNPGMISRWKREFTARSGDFSKKKVSSVEAQELKALKKDSGFVETPKEYLKKRIKIIFEENREIYGSHRIQKKLEREGLKYCRSYIGLLMKEMGLKSVLRRKFVATTDSNHAFPIAENVLNRNFESLQIGEKWISDITYIRVNDNWNYLTTIIDLADRKVVSWTLSEDMTAQNTIIKAWYLARNKRQIKENFIFHSDRGVQYASNKITSLFSFNNKITQSMSRKGNCWDNAVAESFFKTIKHEWLYRFKFTSYTQLYQSIEDYIDWYNTLRLHSSLGYLTPLEMELKLKGIMKQSGLRKLVTKILGSPVSLYL